jgi:hypothetical protein
MVVGYAVAVDVSMRLSLRILVRIDHHLAAHHHADLLHESVGADVVPAADVRCLHRDRAVFQNLQVDDVRVALLISLQLIVVLAQVTLEPLGFLGNLVDAHGAVRALDGVCESGHFPLVGAGVADG